MEHPGSPLGPFLSCLVPNGACCLGAVGEPPLEGHTQVWFPMSSTGCLQYLLPEESAYGSFSSLPSCHQLCPLPCWEDGWRDAPLTDGCHLPAPPIETQISQEGDDGA